MWLSYTSMTLRESEALDSDGCVFCSFGILAKREDKDSQRYLSKLLISIKLARSIVTLTPSYSSGRGVNPMWILQNYKDLLDYI